MATGKEINMATEVRFIGADLFTPRPTIALKAAELSELAGLDITLKELGTRDDGPMARCDALGPDGDVWPDGWFGRADWNVVEKAVLLFEPGSHIDLLDDDDLVFYRYECVMGEDGQEVVERIYCPDPDTIPWDGGCRP